VAGRRHHGPGERLHAVPRRYATASAGSPTAASSSWTPFSSGPRGPTALLLRPEGKLLWQKESYTAEGQDILEIGPRDVAVTTDQRIVLLG